MKFDAQEYNFGKQSQTATLPFLKKLCPTIEETQNTFDAFDYADETHTIFAELKTRRNKKDAYPTTMVNLSKIQKIVEGNTYYFVFNFTDGIYYIKYEKTLFDTFEVKISGRCDRGRPEYEEYVFIPVDLLCPLQ